MTEEFLPVRLSHLLGHCSVGAIVRGSDSLMVVRDVRDWYPPGESPRNREIHYVDQVRSALGISQALCRPPVQAGAGRHHTGMDTGAAVPFLDALSTVRLDAQNAMAQPGGERDGRPSLYR